MSLTEVPVSMQGLGSCGEDSPCFYHTAKVGARYTGLTVTAEQVAGSENPPALVWGKSHLQAITEVVETLKAGDGYQKLPVAEKIVEVLKIVDAYWVQRRDYLDAVWYPAWQAWRDKLSAKSPPKYAAGGWASSPQQLSQLVETLKVLDETGFDTENYLRIGTASGRHAQQEVLGLGLAGITPHLTVIDLCLPPLVETAAVAKNAVAEVKTVSALDVPLEMMGKYGIVTTHFVESFTPTAEQYEGQQMDHQGALALKQQFLAKVLQVLHHGGVFLMTLGTSTHPRRFQGVAELEVALKNAGFNETLIVSTTDPYDYAEGKLLPGNFFCVAYKEEGNYL